MISSRSSENLCLLPSNYNYIIFWSACKVTPPLICYTLSFYYFVYFYFCGVGWGGRYCTCLHRVLLYTAWSCLSGNKHLPNSNWLLPWNTLEFTFMSIFESIFISILANFVVISVHIFCLYFVLSKAQLFKGWIVHPVDKSQSTG